MSADMLMRIAPRYRFRPDDWHKRLADRIPYMAVIGTFRHALLLPDGLWFHSSAFALRARQYQEDVCKVFGRKMNIYHAPDPQRPVELPQTRHWNEHVNPETIGVPIPARRRSRADEARRMREASKELKLADAGAATPAADPRGHHKEGPKP